jgi:hypothetical protein
VLAELCSLIIYRYAEQETQPVADTLRQVHQMYLRDKNEKIILECFRIY